MCFFLYVSLFVELCVGCDGLVNVLFTLEGVAMPHIYLMFELCNACLYVSSPFERLLCDCECARLLWYVFHSFSYNLLLSEKTKAFPCFERPILTTKSQHWPLFLWADTFHLERRVLLHENEMTLVRQQHLLWLRTWHAFSLMPLLPTTYSFCAKFCTYITHCCRCTIILYKMYHTVIVPSLFMIFPSKATSKKLIGLGSLQDFCRTIYLI